MRCVPCVSGETRTDVLCSSPSRILKEEAYAKWFGSRTSCRLEQLSFLLGEMVNSVRTSLVADCRYPAPTGNLAGRLQMICGSQTYFVSPNRWAHDERTSLASEC